MRIEHIIFGNLIENEEYGFEECGQRMDADIEGQIGPGHSKREARR